MQTCTQRKWEHKTILFIRPSMITQTFVKCKANLRHCKSDKQRCSFITNQFCHAWRILVMKKHLSPYKMLFRTVPIMLLHSTIFQPENCQNWQTAEVIRLVNVFWFLRLPPACACRPPAVCSSKSIWIPADLPPWTNILHRRSTQKNSIKPQLFPISLHSIQPKLSKLNGITFNEIYNCSSI